MASVWAARLQGKHGFERLVAIKTILPRFADDHRFRKMFLDEARIASRIEHANVAQILDLGEQHDILYLVMDLIDGESLAKLARAVEPNGGRFPLGIALRVLADACAGLHAAHELSDAAGMNIGVVHRDVSPQNILISSQGTIKLIDFGVAKARDRHAEETSTGILKGKIHYMAPEQATGKPLDRRADIWSIGAILYRLLTGRCAFEGSNQLATLHLLTSGDPPDPLPSTVPRVVDAIVRRAMSHDVERRYATAAELHAALEDAIREADVATSVHDVAAFLSRHMASRTASRKEAIALAIKSAGDRSRVASLLDAHAETTKGSDATLTAPGEGSIGTLATASLDTLQEPRPKRKKARIWIASASAGIALVGVVAATLRAARPTQAPDGVVPAVTASDPPSPENTNSAANEALPAPPTSQTAQAWAPREPAATAPASSAPPARASAHPSKHVVVAKPKPPAPSPPASAPRRHRVDDGF
jgi:serine/threonine-protein kinase